LFLEFAPILLADPSANITAVWLGVMIGLNIQTSFLTPPFGFALFYLRGVADKVVKTLDIYKGASAFILLQLVGLAIVGFNPSLVNYLPNRAHLLSDTAPPPMNPKLQRCLENYTLNEVATHGEAIKAAIFKAKKLDIAYLPKDLQNTFNDSLNDAETAFKQFEVIQTERQAVTDYSVTYQPLQHQVRQLTTAISKVTEKIAHAKSEDEKAALLSEKETLEASIPETWAEKRKVYKDLSLTLKKARRQYYNSADSSYESINELQQTIKDNPALMVLKKDLVALKQVIIKSKTTEAITKIKVLENKISDLKGTEKIKGRLAKARRTLKKDHSDEAKDKALSFYEEALSAFNNDILWREKASVNLLKELKIYQTSISKSIGLRSQKRLTDEQAKDVAACLSKHRNVSLEF